MVKDLLTGKSGRKRLLTEADVRNATRWLYWHMVPKLLPLLVMAAAASMYYSQGRRLLVSAVWLAAALGFVMTRLLQF
jgi:hypothetical protein